MPGFFQIDTNDSGGQSYQPIQALTLGLLINTGWIGAVTKNKIHLSQNKEAKYLFLYMNFSQEILQVTIGFWDVKVQMPWHHTGLYNCSYSVKYLVIFQQKATEVRNQKGHLKKIEDLGAAMEERLILDNR